MDSTNFIGAATALIVMPMAIGLVFAVVLQPRRTLANWLFVLFAFSVVSWAFAALLRFLELDGIDRKPLLYTQISGLMATVISFAIFAIFFASSNPKIARNFTMAGLALGSASILMLWSDVMLAWEGRTWSIAIPGYAVLVAGIAYLGATFYILRQDKNARTHAIQIPAALILVGLIGNGVPFLTQTPFDFMMASLAVLVLGRQVLYFQVFDPMEAANQQLTAMNDYLQQTNLELAAEKQKVEALNESLRQADQYKSQFLASMSHELRTPLNSIIGYGELLDQGIYGELNEKQKERLNRILRNGESLLTLINDILDLTKMEAGNLMIMPKPITLHHVVDAVETIVLPQVEGKGLTFNIERGTDLHTIYGDEMRLRQVLLNLLNNAIKFTNEGEISLRVLNTTLRNGQSPDVTLPSKPPVRDGDWLAICIADTGIGIAAENLTRIFEKFQQVDSSSTRAYGGSGIGLAISRNIIEMHRGHLWANSQPNQGSQFYVILPALPEGVPTNVPVAEA